MLVPFFTTLFQRISEETVTGESSITAFGFNGAGLPDIGLNSFTDLLHWLKSRTNYTKKIHNAKEFHYTFHLHSYDIIFTGYRQTGLRRWTLTFSTSPLTSAHEKLAFLNQTTHLFTIKEPS